MHLYIRRQAQVPLLDANLTLPWVGYVETVIAPTSVTGGGTYINFNGLATTAVPVQVYTSLPGGPRYLGAGDLVDINVVFSQRVKPLGLAASITLKGFNRAVGYSHMLDNFTAVFLLEIQPNETVLPPDVLTYLDTFSLQTSSRCGIVDLMSGLCAAQNLPPPRTRPAEVPLTAADTADLPAGVNATLVAPAANASASAAAAAAAAAAATATTATIGPAAPPADLLSGAALHVSPAPAFVTSFQFIPDALTTWNASAPGHVQYGVGANVKVPHRPVVAMPLPQPFLSHPAPPTRRNASPPFHAPPSFLGGCTGAAVAARLVDWE